MDNFEKYGVYFKKPYWYNKSHETLYTGVFTVYGEEFDTVSEIKIIVNDGKVVSNRQHFRLLKD